MIEFFITVLMAGGAVIVWFRVGLYTHDHIMRTGTLDALHPPPNEDVNSEEHIAWFLRQMKTHRRYSLGWPLYWLYAVPRRMLLAAKNPAGRG